MTREWRTNSVRRRDKYKASRFGWIAYATLAAAVFIGLIWIVALATMPDFVVSLGLVMVGNSLLLAAVGAFFAWAPRKEGTLTMADGELTFPGGHVASKDITSGIVIRADDGCTVELTAGDERIEIELDSVDHGYQLLAAIGVDAAGRAAATRLGIVYPTPLVAVAFTLLTLVSVRAYVPVTAELFFIPLALAFVVGNVVALAWAGTDVVVGRDGIQVTRFVSNRFIPFEDVADVSVAGTQLRIALHDGATIAVGASGAGNVRRTRALLERIQQAMALDELGPSGASRKALERRDESVGDWRSRLRLVLDGGQDYRAGMLSTNDALAIVGDPGSTPEHRVGAALALAEAGLDATARDRLRLAAETSANPKLRIAFEAIAEGDDEEEAIEEALDSARG